MVFPLQCGCCGTANVWWCVWAAGWEGVSNAVLDISLLLPTSSSLSCVAVATLRTHRHGVVVAYPCLHASKSSHFYASQFIACCGVWAFFWSRLETAKFLGWHLSKTRCLRLLLATLYVVLHLCLIKIPQASFLSKAKHVVMQCPSHTVTKDSITTFH